MTIVIQPHRAPIQTFAFRSVLLAFKTKTATMQRHVRRAVLASSQRAGLAVGACARVAHREAPMMIRTRRLLASRVCLDMLQRRATPDRARHAWRGSTRLRRLMRAPTAQLGLQMMTRKQTHRAWDAWPVSMQSLGTTVPASPVVQVSLGLRLVALALQPVKPVKPVSTAPRDRARVSSAHLAQQTKTPMRRHRAHRAPPAHTQGVVRPHATSVLLARSTATRIRPRRALHAWQVSTGRLVQR